MERQKTPRVDTEAPAECINPPEGPDRSGGAEHARTDGGHATPAAAQLRALEEQRRRHKLPGMRMGYLIAAECVFVPYFSYRACMSFADGNWTLGLLFAALAIGSIFLYRITLSPEQTLLARQLAKTDDVRAVGRLAEALEWPDADSRSAAMKGLTRLLPQLKASDAHLLSVEQRECLYNYLIPANAKDEFVIAILSAFEQVGDDAAIAPVEQLAAAARTDDCVRDAALNCLGFLRVRAEEAHNARTLLRASEAGPVSTGELLRPAAPDGATQTEGLLRPSDVSHEDAG
jgi:hypothetical protein